MQRMRLPLLGCVLFCFVIGSGNIWAQGTAQISGSAHDQTGALLPGVEIQVTQTDTGIMREAVTNETGLYVLPNLPIGPYRLEASLPGFRTYTQTGIVLQVNGSPSINLVLEVGSVSEQVEVQANAALVETRTAGVGSVVENARILELPLNGRQVVELIGLSGGATPAPTITGGSRDPFGQFSFSVAGGLNTGLSYTLDGANHNNMQDNSYVSLPFPDALQEFKVETGATSAQNGVKSSGSVTLVTKSGTNAFHGDAFEFVRNGMFNAQNAFATRHDTIKRNQFGGTMGGPIIRNKLFFFGGYQGTTVRQDPSDTISFVATPAMLTGDFTAFASPACNGGRQINLRAPFVNNRIDPALFNKASVKMLTRLPETADPCGKAIYGNPSRENRHQAIGKIDYQKSAKHSLFGRYLTESLVQPSPYDINKNPLSINTAVDALAQAFTLGSTYLAGANIVNSFRVTANRVAAGKFLPDTIADAHIGSYDLGINAFNYAPYTLRVTVTGGFKVGTQGGPTRTAVFGANDDISILHGNHQMAFGANATAWWSNSYSGNYHVNFNFNGQTTGLGMADFFIGRASQFVNGPVSQQNKRSKYIGLYAADTWNATSKLTFTYGLRWEPYFPMINLDGSAVHYDENALKNGIRSRRFDNSPPGLTFDGDPGFPGRQAMYNQWLNFSPRVGLAWDVTGKGRTSVRASFGTFYDFPHTQYQANLGATAPWAIRYTLTDVNFENPWATFPGGDPFPMPYGRDARRDVPWPLYQTVTAMDYDTKTMEVSQWNLSLQQQISTDWLISASYIGTASTHLWSAQPINPAIFLGLDPCTLNGIRYSVCSTTSNTDQRRRLSLEIPQVGQYYGHIGRIDSGGTASYNGLLVSVQRRAVRGVTLNANYTWSHCITDHAGDMYVNQSSTGWTNPNNRTFDRGNCTIAATDRHNILNLSAVAETPQFSNPTLRAAASGWRFSPIFKLLSGEYLTMTTSQDRALNSISGQRVNQTLAGPYGDKSVSNYLNPAAFAMPALGTLGNVGSGSIAGPGTWQLDAALSRTFRLGETRKLEFRAEAFNLTNAFRMEDPDTVLNSNTFGQVISAKEPRIMQFALKYVF